MAAPGSFPSGPRTRRSPASRRGRWFALALLLLLLAAGAAAYWVIHASTARKSTEISVTRGTGLSTVATQLHSRGVIDSPRAFMAVARFSGAAAIKPGDYAIEQGMSARAILARLVAGRVIVRMVMIPQGMPSVLVRERLMAVPILAGDPPPPPEGSVLPDSYAYSRGEPRAAVIERMQAAMRKALAEAWANRSPRAVVRSPEEAVILASIVEKETGVASERRLIAGVYSNRLRIGMPLQADPTVIYPVTQGRPLGRRILRSELMSDNPYNTYRHPGLPPGPITNPGRAAIEAVLNPDPTRALYFVAKGDGGHAFAEILSEHNANVQHWYAIRDQQ